MNNREPQKQVFINLLKIFSLMPNWDLICTLLIQNALELISNKQKFI